MNIEGSVGEILNKSPLAQARGGCRGGCQGISGSIVRPGLIGAANVSLPRYMFFPSVEVWPPGLAFGLGRCGEAKG
jgi:hypothetical protein